VTVNLVLRKKMLRSIESSESIFVDDSIAIPCPVLANVERGRIKASHVRACSLNPYLIRL
jgi:hypothetical protein